MQRGGAAMCCAFLCLRRARSGTLNCGGPRVRARTGRRTMKALAKSRRERGLWLEDVPEPEYGINDVLIRVRYTGICGTDVHIYDWDGWGQKTIPVPMVIGHEFVGEIVEVGSN